MALRALLGLMVLAGCGPKDIDRDDKTGGVCATTPAEGTVMLLAEGFDQTEGIAFSDDGRLFVTAGDLIAEIQPDGTWSETVPWEGGVGLAWWNGRLAAAGRDGADGVVGLIDVDTGAVEILTRDIPTSNFLAVTPWDSLLVADADARIWEVGPTGMTAPWLDIAGPNGMAFTETGDALWVVNTWDNPAPAWRIELAGTTAGPLEVVHEWEIGNFPDGVALGQSGDLYTALNATGRISRLSPDGTERTVAEGVDWTASIAFGVGDRWDPCSVYSTSLFSDAVYRVAIGEPGLEL